MLVRRIFISGRVVTVPSVVPHPSPSNGATFLMAVHDGEDYQIWSAFLPNDNQLSGQIADGDMVAAVGWVDENRERIGEIEGPLVVEAVLAMNCDGYFFGRIEE